MRCARQHPPTHEPGVDETHAGDARNRKASNFVTLAIFYNNIFTTTLAYYFFHDGICILIIAICIARKLETEKKLTSGAVDIN